MYKRIWIHNGNLTLHYTTLNINIKGPLKSKCMLTSFDLY